MAFRQHEHVSTTIWGVISDVMSEEGEGVDGKVNAMRNMDEDM